jgi:hypothetical protein
MMDINPNRPDAQQTGERPLNLSDFAQRNQITEDRVWELIEEGELAARFVNDEILILREQDALDEPQIDLQETPHISIHGSSEILPTHPELTPLEPSMDALRPSDDTLRSTDRIAADINSIDLRPADALQTPDSRPAEKSSQAGRPTDSMHATSVLDQPQGLETMRAKEAVERGPHKAEKPRAAETPQILDDMRIKDDPHAHPMPDFYAEQDTAETDDNSLPTDDYRDLLVFAQDAMNRTMDLSRQLLGTKDELIRMKDERIQQLQTEQQRNEQEIRRLRKKVEDLETLCRLTPNP